MGTATCSSPHGIMPGIRHRDECGFPGAGPAFDDAGTESQSPASVKSVHTSLRIVHGVSYHFVEPISGLAIRTCLRPRNSVHWHCTFAQLLVQPEASDTADSLDSHGNQTA